MKRLYIVFSLLLCLSLIINGITMAAEAGQVSASSTTNPTVKQVDTAKDTGQNESTIKHLFSDVKGHWAETSINNMKERGVIDGFPDGTFRPDDPVKVDELIKMIVYSLTEKTKSGKIVWAKDYMDNLPMAKRNEMMDLNRTFDLNNPPKDNTYWAKPYIELAANLGIVKLGDFDFNYEVFKKDCTREMAAYFLNTTLQTFEFIENDLYRDLARLAIKDFDGGTEWYQPDVEIVIVKGLMRGYPDGTFRPKGNITRAEAVFIVDRILNRSLRDPYVPDLSNLPHIQYETKFGTRHAVFQKQEFLDTLDVMRKAAGTSSGWANLSEEDVVFYKDKKTHDDYVEQIKYVPDPWSYKDPFEFEFGIDSVEKGYFFTLNFDQEDNFALHQKPYDEILQQLFGESVGTFKQKMSDFAEKYKKTLPDAPEPDKFLLNGRSVIIMVEVKGWKYIGAFITDKK